MRDYAEAVRSFAYEEAVNAALQGDLGALNACVECCDRHVGTDKAALVWEDRDGNGKRYSFEQLQEMAARFANVLRSQGVGPGDRVAGLLPRTPELLVTILATWRLGAVYQLCSLPLVRRPSSTGWSNPGPRSWSPTGAIAPSSMA